LEKSWNYILLDRFDEKYKPVKKFKKDTDSVIAYSSSSNNMNDRGIALCEIEFSECWDNFYKDDTLAKPKSIDHSSIPEFINSIKLYQFLIADKVLYESNKQKFYSDFYDVLVVPSKEKVKKNEEFSAKIYLVGHNSRTVPYIGVRVKGVSDTNEYEPIEIEAGVGKFNAVSDKSGLFEYEGEYLIHRSDKEGITNIPFKIKYEVE
jgi:hypothetical protein